MGCDPVVGDVLEREWQPHMVCDSFKAPGSISDSDILGLGVPFIYI